MTEVARFETVTDLGEGGEPDSPLRLRVSATMTAVLADGRRVRVHDRGWSEVVHGVHEIEDFDDPRTAEDTIETARVVVGPDEPPEGRTPDEEEALHWAAIADDLAAHGVTVPGDPLDLAALPHDVVLSDALRARLSPPPSAPRSPAT